MKTVDDYRFRIASEFYDILHQKMECARQKENKQQENLGWFFRRQSLLGKDWHQPDVLPSREHLSDIVDIAFWASLAKEEGRSVRFKIGYKASFETYGNEIDFSQPLEYTTANLTKIAPSCGYKGSLLVGPSSNGLVIFGRDPDGYSFFGVKVLDPGQLVLHAGQNLAAISGSEVVFIRNGLLGVYGQMWDKLGKWWGDDKDDEADERHIALVNLARRIRRLGHGGAVIITPEDDAWRCCVSKITYESRTKLGAIREALNFQTEERKRTGEDPFHCVVQVDDAISDMAYLTQVDGAVLLRPDLSLVGFGAKLIPADRNPALPMYEVDPLDHSDNAMFHQTNSIMGTRHSSAARFVQDNPEALAIVVSEDGVVSCFVTQEVNGDNAVVRYKRLELTLF